MVWCRMTDSDMATQAGEEHVSRAHVPIPRGGDPAFPNLGIHGIHTIHGRYLCQNGLTYHDQNWCGNMWGQHVSRRSVMPHPKGGGAASQKISVPTRCVHTIWGTAAKFCTVVKQDVRATINADVQLVCNSSPSCLTTIESYINFYK